ncbi:MAG: hypothetical protein JWQ21_3995 [Herminiimonas sp.]|nr:hypothetical protein [Herminiimonas sp.]
MKPFIVGSALGAIVIPFLLAAIVLLVAKLLKLGRGASYVITIASCFIPPFFTIGGPTTGNIIGASVIAVIMFWDYRRALSQDAAAQTRQVG